MNIKLDSHQQAAVDYRGGNLLILAGAGSGKTRTLTQRAVSFLKDLQPEQLVMVTFTNKAANEIKDRLFSATSADKQPDLKRAWIGTIHSICSRILRNHGNLVGLDDNWSVLDMDDSQKLMRNVGASLGVTRFDHVKHLLPLHSYSRNCLTPWNELLGKPAFKPLSAIPVETLNNVFGAYDRRCRRSSRLDFDALQTLTLELLTRHEAARNYYQNQFRAIFIDEYQDTNKVQAEILRQLSHSGNSVTVVGDDAQSIYAFRAATIDNILGFPAEFNASKVILPRNYRSSGPIVNLSNCSISNNKQRYEKTIEAVSQTGTLPEVFTARDQVQEARYVVDKIRDHLESGLPLSEVAILVRATRLAAAVQVALKEEGIDSVIQGGSSFFASQHIKAVLDVLRATANPEDTIALSSSEELIEGRTSLLLEKIERQADGEQLSFWGMFTKLIGTNIPDNEQEGSTLLRLNEKIAKIRELFDSTDGLEPVIAASIKLVEKPLHFKNKDNWELVKEDFSLLMEISKPYNSLSEFINLVSLDQNIDNDPNASKGNSVLISTIHSAKGLEWDSVFVMGLVEFWFPFQYAITDYGSDEEERRLFYVAITRARRNLILTAYEQEIDQNGNTRKQKISRFIEELPKASYRVVRSHPSS